jgi:hypothetical protein
MPIGQPGRSPRERAAIAPMFGAALVAAAILHPADARAHAVLDTATALAGTYHKLVVRIGHGCSGSPTVELTVELPDGAAGASQPKPVAGRGRPRSPGRCPSATVTATR